MVHPSVAAAAAATSVNSVSASSPSRKPRPPVRIRSTGSFHAGAPIPHLGSSALRRESSSLSPSRRRPRPSLISRLHRQPAIQKYHTFSADPAKETPNGRSDPECARNGPFVRGLTATRRRRKSGGGGGSGNTSPTKASSSSRHGHDSTPLPWKQLGLLALLSLAEQTALNSISPYLPTMVTSFDEVPDGEEGLYVGLLASAFALAQLATNLLWGYLSDTVGRKPVMLAGTSLLTVCFVFFGFCSDFAQLTIVHVAMGLLNGNAAVVPTCLGEVTDRSNQSRAFIWLPVMYSIGGITGPALGGLLVGVGVPAFPFLVPNIVSAALLMASVVVLAVWFDETLDGADQKAAGAGLAWAEKLFSWGRVFQSRRRARRRYGWCARWPRAGRHATVGPAAGDDASASEDEDDEDEDSPERQTLLGSPSPLPSPPADGIANGHGPANGAGVDGFKDPDTGERPGRSAFRQLANRTTMAVLITYLFFQVANISFNSLYPIFATAPPPTGRDLGPGTIGLSLSLAGLATILFQVSFFQPLKCRLGNLGTYKISLLGIALSMALMPWVGYLDKNEEGTPSGIGAGKAWLYSELGVILIIKNVCAVGGLSSVMLLVSCLRPFPFNLCRGAFEPLME